MVQSNRIDKADPLLYITPLLGNWDEIKPIKKEKKMTFISGYMKSKDSFSLTEN